MPSAALACTHRGDHNHATQMLTLDARSNYARSSQAAARVVDVRRGDARMRCFQPYLFRNPDLFVSTSTRADSIYGGTVRAPRPPPLAAVAAAVAAAARSHTAHRARCKSALKAPPRCLLVITQRHAHRDQHATRLGCASHQCRAIAMPRSRRATPALASEQRHDTGKASRTLGSILRSWTSDIPGRLCRLRALRFGHMQDTGQRWLWTALDRSRTPRGQANRGQPLPHDITA